MVMIILLLITIKLVRPDDVGPEDNNISNTNNKCIVRKYNNNDKTGSS